jgi:hypothetical protein
MTKLSRMIKGDGVNRDGSKILCSTFPDRGSQISHISAIAIRGDCFSANMPLGPPVEHFFQKGGYTPEQLLAKMKEVITDSPIRPPKQT